MVRRRHARNAVLGGLALVIMGSIWAPRADAYHLEGQRWPKRTITYHNLAPAYAWSLARAVEAWNESGSKLRFVEKPRRKAQVLIRAQNTGFGCMGYASVGFVPPWAGGGYVWIDRNCDRYTGAGILAHELGHVLGLGHEDRRCATMNSALWINCSGQPEVGQWRCRLLERDDVRGAVRRYGGKVLDPGPKYCWQHPPPPPPSDIVVTPNPDSGADALLEWKNTSNRGLTGVLVARKRGSCPADEDDGDDSFQLGGDPGSRDSYEDLGEEPLETGSYCYAFWSLAVGGRAGPPATAWMNYTDVFPPPTGLSVKLAPPSGATAQISWTASSNPFADSVLVLRGEDTCPSSVDDLSSSWVDEVGTEPGQPGSAEDWEPLESGRWCYALWTVSEELFGRHSRLPATILVDVP